MSRETLAMTDTLHRYLLDASLREPEVMKRLRDETAALPDGQMQISPEQGQFMRFLVRAIGAVRALEVGTFTGYSALSVAMALPEDGTLVACDVSEEWTAIARRYWKEAGIDHKIDLRLGPGADTLRALLADGQAGRFDFAFIDADKTGYAEYYELCLRLVRRGGIISFDNMLQGGSVADPSATDATTQAIRDLNTQLRRDERVDLTLVPIGDGLSLVRKI
jgi:predicted O-methyltransferase YrrM